MDTIKPTITLDLPNHLIDFLYHEFKVNRKGELLLNRNTDIGRFISSMWESQDFPVKKITFENPVIIALPINQDDHYKLRQSFIYISDLKRRMIHDHLKAVFELRRDKFFHEGYRLGYRQIDIIEAFMKAYGIKNNSQNFDQLKKMDYRKRDRLRLSITQIIQSAVV